MNALLKTQRCELCGQQTDLFPTLCKCCYNDSIKFNLPALDYNLLNWPAFYHAITPVIFDQLIALAPYQWPYSRWVIQLKYQGCFEVSKLLSSLMFKAWQENEVLNQTLPHSNTGVIAVPINIKKWQSRGYNQAYLLAKFFCQKNKIPDLSYVLTRKKDTVNQVGLTGVERRKNLKQAFSIQKHIALPTHIILIDDVLTTGTTANEISKLLKLQGVEHITVFTICLSLPSNKKS